jgi:hypothetical protein
LLAWILTRFLVGISQVKAALGEPGPDELARGFAGLLMAGVQPEWGWAVLWVAAILVIGAAAAEEFRRERGRWLAVNGVLGTLFLAVLTASIAWVSLPEQRATRRTAKESAEHKPGAAFPADKPAQRETAKKSAEKKSAPEYIDVSASAARVGNVEVRVTEVTLDKVPLVELGIREGESKEPALCIHVSICNLSETKKLEYHTWAAEGGRIFDRNPASLKDDLGNRYIRVHYGLLTKPKGQKERESIHPGQSADDVLVFEPPVQKASAVLLELPMKAFEGEGDGTIHFRVPASMYSRGT